MTSSVTEFNSARVWIVSKRNWDWVNGKLVPLTRQRHFYFKNEDGFFDELHPDCSEAAGPIEQLDVRERVVRYHASTRWVGAAKVIAQCMSSTPGAVTLLSEAYQRYLQAVFDTGYPLCSREEFRAEVERQNPGIIATEITSDGGTDVQFTGLKFHVALSEDVSIADPGNLVAALNEQGELERIAGISWN